MHVGMVVEMASENLADRIALGSRNLLFVERTTGETRHAFYEDDLVRTPEGWRIARCRCRFHGAGGLADRPPK